MAPGRRVGRHQDRVGIPGVVETDKLGRGRDHTEAWNTIQVLSLMTFIIIKKKKTDDVH